VDTVMSAGKVKKSNNDYATHFSLGSQFSFCLNFAQKFSTSSAKTLQTMRKNPFNIFDDSTKKTVILMERVPEKKKLFSKRKSFIIWYTTYDWLHALVNDNANYIPNARGTDNAENPECYMNCHSLYKYA
jgi:hypothetical protein